MHNSPSSDFPYVSRTGDEDLLKYLNNKQCCYVQSPPRTGKTRLLETVKGQLQENEVNCAAISLKDLIDIPSEWEWNLDLFRSLEKELNLGSSQISRNFFKPERRQHFQINPQEALGGFIDTVILEDISKEIVIFLDDIDSLSQLNFQNQQNNQQQVVKNYFFQTLYQCYKKRNSRFQEESDKYNRLTFVLAGSEPKSSLIQGSVYDIFENDIYRWIRLEDFRRETLESHQEASEWIRQKVISPREIRDIFKKTQGHPALTTQSLNELRDPDRSLDDVLPILIEQWTIHLEAIKNKLELPENQPLLDLYRDALDEKKDVEANHTDRNQQRLVAWGIAAWRSNLLVIHNPIFEQISKSWDCIAQNVLEPATQPTTNSSLEEITSSLSTQSTLNPEPDGSSTANSDASSTASPPDDESNTSLTSQATPVSEQTPSPDNHPQISKLTIGSFFGAVMSAISSVAQFMLADNVTGWSLVALTVICFSLALSKFREDNPRQLQALWQLLCRRIYQTITSIRSFLQRHSRRLLSRLIITLITLGIVLLLQNYLKALIPGWRESEIQKDAVEALNTFKSGKPMQLEALKTAIKAGNDLKDLQNIHKYLFWTKDRQHPVVPLLALQYIYDNIHERNRYERKNFKEFRDIAVSPDGKTIAATGVSSQGNRGDHAADWIVLWNSSNEPNEPLLPTPFRTYHSGINDLDLSNNSQYLVTAGDDGKIKIWNLETQEIREPHQEISWKRSQKVPINSVRFSLNAKYLAATASDGYLKIWKLNNDFKVNPHPFIQKEIRSPLSGEQVSNSLSINSNCLIAVDSATANSRKLRVWNIDEVRIENSLVKTETDQQDFIKEMILPPPFTIKYSPTSVSISPNKSYVAIGGKYEQGEDKGKGIVQIWEFDLSKPVCTLTSRSKRKEEIFDAPASSVRFDESANYLFVIGYGGSFKVLQMPENESEESKHLIETNLEMEWPKYKKPDVGSIHPNRSKQFFTVTREDKVRLWDLGIQKKHKEEESVNPLSPIRIINVRDRTSTNTIVVVTDKELAQIFGSGLTPRGYLNSPTNMDGKITSLAASNDGNHLATGSNNGLVQFWDWSKARPQQGYQDFSIGEVAITDLTFNPKNENLIAVASSNAIQLYDTTGEPEGQSIDSDLRSVQSVAFSPDGKYLAIRDDNMPKIWDISNLSKPEQVKLSSLESLGWFKQGHLLFKKKATFPADKTVQDIQFYPKNLDQKKAIFAVLSSEDSRGVDFWQLSNEKGMETNLVASLDATKLSGKWPNLFQSGEKLDWYKMEFHPEGTYMAIGSQDEILVWDLSGQLQGGATELEERLVAVFRGNWGKITSLRFFANGNLVAGSETGKLIKVQIGDLDTLLDWGHEWSAEYRSSHE